jgi:hypothetical protein
MKVAIFWDVAPCSLVEIYRRFSDAYCPHHQGASVNFYQTTRRNIPEDSHTQLKLLTFVDCSLYVAEET